MCIILRIGYPPSLIVVIDRPPTSELSVVFGDPPLIRIAGYGADKVVNDELIFSCDAKLFQIDLLLQKLWYHNGVLLDVLTNPDLGFGHNNGTLTFRSFKASMAGLYSCTVNYLGFPDINVTRTAPLEVFIQGTIHYLHCVFKKSYFYFDI